MSGRQRARVVVLSLVLALVAAACQPPWEQHERLEHPSRVLGERATVIVTTDGGKELVIRRSIPLERHTTVFEALEAVAAVTPGPGGTVLEVNGMGGGRLLATGPEQAAWFYRVNGIEGTADPRRYKVPRGAAVWWDLRRFDIYERVPVAVGMFPDSLIRGYRDSLRPLRISYGPGFREDAEYYRETLFRELDPEVRSIDAESSLLGGHDGPKPKLAVRPDRANFVIGRWEDIRLDPHVADIALDPRTYGITVWIEGTDVRRQDPDEEFSRELDAEGVVWASTIDGEPDGPIVFVVTGVTNEGVRAAARALKRGHLQGYLAAAVDRDGNVLD